MTELLMNHITTLPALYDKLVDTNLFRIDSLSNGNFTALFLDGTQSEITKDTKEAIEDDFAEATFNANHPELNP